MGDWKGRRRPDRKYAVCGGVWGQGTGIRSRKSEIEVETRIEAGRGAGTKLKAATGTGTDLAAVTGVAAVAVTVRVTLSLTVPVTVTGKVPGVVTVTGGARRAGAVAAHVLSRSTTSLCHMRQAPGSNLARSITNNMPTPSTPALPPCIHTPIMFT